MSKEAKRWQYFDIMSEGMVDIREADTLGNRTNNKNKLTSCRFQY